MACCLGITCVLHTLRRQALPAALLLVSLNKYYPTPFLLCRSCMRLGAYRHLCPRHESDARFTGQVRDAHLPAGSRGPLRPVGGLLNHRAFLHLIPNPQDPCLRPIGLERKRMNMSYGRRASGK